MTRSNLNNYSRWINGTMTAPMQCNALLSSALSPDVDSDGDGEDDLLSLGLRVAAAVPVTIVDP